jgi:translation initiation factor IF-3
MSSRQAQSMAYEYELDLLCVAPNANPPVCKIIDYGKYHFQEQKKAKEAKKKQHIIEIREIQLTPQIGQNDLLIKAKKAREFFEEGNKVRVVVCYRGRQLAHPEVGQEVLSKFISILSDVSLIEKPSVLEGKFLSTTLGPKVIKKTN